MDILSISNLELWTHIGVTEEEREVEQRVLATLTVEVAENKAGKTDDVKDTVNYEEISDAIKEVALRQAPGERRTLEKFAEEIAEVVLQHKNVQSVTVELRKFVLPRTRSVSITITRP